MAAHDEITVDRSLEMLSEAVGKAAADFAGVRITVDRARQDVASRNTSISRTVIKDIEQAITHLRETDQSLQHVLRRLADRD
jgi:hypothetical protein